jgi:deoxyhypusine synthase
MAQVALMNKPILWIMDGATMDAGLSPLLVYLMRRGLIQCLVMNGEAALRDYELAFHGTNFANQLATEERINSDES